MTTFSPGDRIQTLTGRPGILQNPTVNMPNHHLIRFDDGILLWVIKDAVELAPEKITKQRKIA